MSETPNTEAKATDLTWEEKADKLYRYIHDYLKDNARGPSHREMYAHMQCSPNTLGELLDNLEQTGRPIHRVKGCWRRIWVPMSVMPDEGE